jgi:hypothetical protein
MNDRMRQLEQQRHDLVIRTRDQREQLIAFAVSAGQTSRRLQLFLLTARAAVSIRGLWKIFRP